jgi:hypothetical protein
MSTLQPLIEIAFKVVARDCVPSAPVVLFFSFWSREAFPFPFWSWELSLFLSFQTSYPTLVGLILSV